MKCLFRWVDEYLREANWKDMALLKLCLFAVGVMVGISIPKEKKKLQLFVAAGLFLLTYIPLMTKFIKVVQKNERE